MVLHGIAWYFIVLHGIASYSIVFDFIAWYCIVVHGVVQFILHSSKRHRSTSIHFLLELEPLSLRVWSSDSSQCAMKHRVNCWVQSADHTKSWWKQGANIIEGREKAKWAKEYWAPQPKTPASTKVVKEWDRKSSFVSIKDKKGKHWGVIWPRVTTVSHNQRRQKQNWEKAVR